MERSRTGDYGDVRWKQLRARKLREHPFCEIRTHCAGALAVEVDHDVPIREAPERKYDWANLRSACKSCHSAKSLAEMRSMTEQDRA